MAASWLAFDFSTPFLVSEMVAIDRIMVVAGRKAGLEVAPSRRVEVRRADMLFGATESGFEESVSCRRRIQRMKGKWKRRTQGEEMVN